MLCFIVLWNSTAPSTLHCTRVCLILALFSVCLCVCLSVHVCNVLEAQCRGRDDIVNNFGRLVWNHQHLKSVLIMCVCVCVYSHKSCMKPIIICIRPIIARYLCEPFTNACPVPDSWMRIANLLYVTLNDEPYNTWMIIVSVRTGCIWWMTWSWG